MKKLICGVLCLAMLNGSIAVGVNGAVPEGQALEESIIKAKSMIDVPKDCTEVDYELNDYGITIQWSDIEQSHMVSVTLTNDGELIEYRNYNYKESYKEGLGTYDKKSCEKYAVEFMRHILGDAADEMKPVLSEGNVYDSVYNFTYKRYVNNIPVEYNGVNIQVNKYTGGVSYYKGTPKSEMEKELPGADGVIDRETAISKYIDTIGIKHKYKSYYNYNTKELKIYPVYTLEDSTDKYIDAVTGEQVKWVEKNINDLSARNTMKEEAAADSGGGLTAEEASAVSDVSGYIAKDEGWKVITDTFDILSKGSTYKSARLVKETGIQQRYVWRYQFESGSAAINAENGEILYFYDYTYNEQSSNITAEQARQKADEFCKINASEKYGQCKIEEYDSGSDTDVDRPYFNFNYSRYVNGIPYDSNGLYVTIEGIDGKVKEYRNNWTDEEFPSLEGTLSEREAFEKINQVKNYGLKYINDENNNAVLVYGFDTGWCEIDSYTGVRIDYNGNEYRKSAPAEYTDIKGMPIESIVNKLLDNGLYIDDTQFRPDQAITKKEFEAYLKVGNDYIMPLRNGEKSDVENKDIPMTRYEMVKYIVELRGYGEIAQKDIYVNVYGDNIPKEYKGYVAIANAFGWYKVEGEYFEGEKYITRAEAAEIIYNYFENK